MKAEPPSTHRFFFGERLSGTRDSPIPFGEQLAGAQDSFIPFGNRPSGTRYSFISFGERLAGTRDSSIPFGKWLSGTRDSAILFWECLSGTRYSQFHISMIPHQHHSSFNCRLRGERGTRPTERRCTAGTRSTGRSTGCNRSPCCTGLPTNSS